MKIINYEPLSSEPYVDMVKTEENIRDNILKNIDSLPVEFNYVNIPIAQTINKYGVGRIQQVIDDIEQKYPVTKRYVCQHILVDKINFYNNTIFTPHTLQQDAKICIPHYNNVITKNNFINPEKRKYKTTFIGSCNTHPIRKQLFEINNDRGIIIRDTGSWFYEKSKLEREKYSNKYVEFLCNSLVGLCPPGTGPSTIRLYEAMAAGVIPVVFNSVKVPPRFEQFVIRINNVEDFKDLEIDSLVKKSRDLYKLYWSNLSSTEVYKLLIT